MINLSKYYKPTETQAKHAEAIEWLIDIKRRGEGKTTAIAWGYIHYALKNPGVNIHLVDFNQFCMDYPSQIRFYELVNYIVQRFPIELRVYFVFNRSMRTMHVKDFIDIDKNW